MGYDGKYGKVTLEKKDIPANEPLFVLRGQDVLAPLVMDYYAHLVELTTGDTEMGGKVRLQGRRMLLWETRKLPD